MQNSANNYILFCVLDSTVLFYATADALVIFNRALFLDSCVTGVGLKDTIRGLALSRY